jgi:hypothetical protein
MLNLPLLQAQKPLSFICNRLHFPESSTLLYSQVTQQRTICYRLDKRGAKKQRKGIRRMDLMILNDTVSTAEIIYCAGWPRKYWKGSNVKYSKILSFIYSSRENPRMMSSEEPVMPTRFEMATSWIQVKSITAASNLLSAILTLCANEDIIFM